MSRNTLPLLIGYLEYRGGVNVMCVLNFEKCLTCRTYQISGAGTDEYDFCLVNRKRQAGKRRHHNHPESCSVSASHSSAYYSLFPSSHRSPQTPTCTCPSHLSSFIFKCSLFTSLDLSEWNSSSGVNLKLAGDGDESLWEVVPRAT